MVELYNTLFLICLEALIPNGTMVKLLPEHQQMYIIKGATASCYKELELQRMLACAEDIKLCVDKSK